MFYRTLLAAVAALVIAMPAFADDTTNTTDTTGTTQTTADNTTTTGDQATTTKVNINTATAKDLMKVKGINASKARAIVAYRKKHGDFKTINDITQVKGFKKLNPTTLENITNQLTVE